MDFRKIGAYGVIVVVCMFAVFALLSITVDLKYAYDLSLVENVCESQTGLIGCIIFGYPQGCTYASHQGSDKYNCCYDMVVERNGRWEKVSECQKVVP